MIQLRKHQQEISEKAWPILLEKRIVYLSMEVRTGKTLTALNIIRKVIANKPQNKYNVLFVTKKKAIGSIKSDFEKAGYEYNLYTTNYESLHKAPIVPWDFIIADEAHCLGTFPKPSKRHKDLKSIFIKNKYAGLILLSGTPAPESYSQLFHQLNVTRYSPFSNYVNFYAWARDGYVDKRELHLGHGVVNDYSKTNLHKIQSKIDPFFITYTQKEAGFTNTINEKIIIVKMKDYTKNLIERLQKTKVIEGKEEVILADTPVKELQKIHQLSSGTITFESGNKKILDTSKSEYIKENFSNQKKAIMYLFKEEGRMLKDTFLNWTESPEEFNESEDKVFIGQIRSSREGVNLSTADCLIMFNIEFSALSYLQGRDRMTSKDRTTPNDVYWIFSDCGIEQKVYSTVKKKQDFTTKIYKGQKQMQLW